MKTASLIYPVFALSLASAASSQLLFPELFRGRDSVAKQASRPQSPIMDKPNIALPPSNQDNPPDDPASGEVIMSDIVGKERSINIFAGFTRDIESVAGRLQDGAQNTTLLAPLNSEVQKLPRKPWEDPKDYDSLGASAYEGAEGEARAHRNLRRFTEAHVVPSSPWKEGEKTETLLGNQIWWEAKNGKKYIQPGDIEVSTVANKVANGELWILKGVIKNYA